MKRFDVMKRLHNLELHVTDLDDFERGYLEATLKTAPQLRVDDLFGAVMSIHKHMATRGVEPQQVLNPRKES